MTAGIGRARHDGIGSAGNGVLAAGRCWRRRGRRRERR